MFTVAVQWHSESMIGAREQARPRFADGAASYCGGVLGGA